MPPRNSLYQGALRPTRRFLGQPGNARGGDRNATFQLVNGVALYGGFTGTETSLEQRDPANSLVHAGAQ